MMEADKLEAVKIAVASPEKIRSWSYGEVKKPETINYRTLKPERDGLFCEKIFGPTKDYECSCGKYKKVRYKGIICDKCGVEVTKAKVRRERMGHIELATPVSHIWFFKGTPSRMGLLLDMSPRDLEEVLYFVSYVVTDPGIAPLQKKQTLSDKEYYAYYEKYGDGFKVGMGADAIKILLSEINLEEELKNLNEELENAQGQKRIRLLKRLDVIDSFAKSGNKPEWIILDALPVLPPELRPMIQLDGGRFATSDLNDLYRRVINRNNRLKKLIELNAPSIIVRNEKRMLQEAVDALFDNGRRGRNITGASNRPLKSLSNMLKGKQGRFRQHLLGKRVDYSGRSVIVVGPELKMYQCGIPKEMALELFKPHIIHELVKREIIHNIKSAKKMIENQDERVWDVVEDVIKEHPVLLNRAPTLHRLGIQAFEPKLVSGRAIRLHPLVTTAFNADFDGDQMAVHVPLSEEAKAEARILMLGANNILNPKDGKPIVTPTQDMILGNYYITIEKKGLEGEGRIFKNPNEALMAYERNEIALHTRIIVPVNSFKHKVFIDEVRNKYLITTVGKIKFNEILPDSFPYISEASTENIEKITPSKYFIDNVANLSEKLDNLPLAIPFNKKALEEIIAQIFKRYKTTETSVMLDKLKDLGFKYSTKAGITMAISDIKVSKQKDEIIAEGDKTVEKINKQYARGLITEEERYGRIIETWNIAKKKIQDELGDIAKTDLDNSIFIMMNSKARGSIAQFTQLAGMRGLMAKPGGGEVEIPVKSSFKEGLSVAEFFLSTHGSRKGSADTALKTADSGYLTRRLVDVVQDVIVRENDCGTIQGVVVRDIVDEKAGTVDLIEKLYDRILGRYSNKKVINPETKEVIIDKGVLITENIAEKIEKAGVKAVEIRNILTCKTHNGVCQKCYGRNLATGNLVEIGEAIGIMAAQSIGEPGTQLTMRTFHTGGVAGGEDITQGLPRVQELFEARNPKGKSTIAEIEGTVTSIENASGRYKIIVSNDVDTKEHLTNFNARLRVSEGTKVTAGDRLTEGNINPKELLAVTDPITVQEYILKEIQKIYSSQGVGISDKHIEVIARRMISRIRVVDPGDTKLLMGKMISVNEFTDANKEVILQGKKPATGRPILLGITKASLETDSFLSAASFQETTRILTDASIKGKVDHLLGLKENVIIGKLIPAGTGAKKYSEVKFDLENEFMDADPLDVLEENLME
ncbi:MAG: DNA-directed RNA polymerase subunit beta' [Bacilli bacterium]|nr:DNA-directed RNA polymerase subunit beta' [Bacilli bacterium]MDD3304682.1 DNA-directed RNA polymerase subunit beta' [Bacilli bacterium]MDD4053266.1 DNA-directed RNA polymerase subunit beta' [Bacilli bacterium]MDD4411394.1 DNA-directed RNA polymerase subunit beta' [Bacilli bacterium]